MARQTIGLDTVLQDYLVKVGVKETSALKQLRDYTQQEFPQVANNQISAEEGQFMGFLVKLISARKILEIGTFTGYSALAMACAMPAGGLLSTCEQDERWLTIAQSFWQQAGVAHKIKTYLAPALNTLNQLMEAGEQDSFDLAFIDADKANYFHYYEHCLRLVKPGGLILIDNTLWSGAVIDEHDQRPSTQTIRVLNDFLYRDERVDLTLVPISDGLTLLRRKV